MTSREFLDAFFGEGNRLGRREVDSRPRLRALVNAFDEEFRRPAVLPRMLLDSKRVIWYLLAFDDDGFRRATEDVKGSIGPTYARWIVPHDAPEAETDAIESLVRKTTDGRYVRFFTENQNEFEALWTPLQRLLALWAERPAPRVGMPHGTTAILREIDLSLAAGDGHLALELLQDLRQRGSISVENVRFIEVLALGAQSRWRELAAHPDFDDLCRIRRPWRVTEALAAAAQHVYFDPFQVAGDVPGAISEYVRRRDVLDDLARVRGPLRSPAFLKLHALHALVVGQNGAQVLAMSEWLESAEDKLWVDALARQYASQTETVRESPLSAFEQGSYDIALAEAVESPNSHDLADVILLAAYELGTLEAATRAIAYWRRLDERARHLACQRRVVRDALDALESLVGAATDPPPPRTWRDWFARLAGDPQWSTAEAVAECGELEFDARDAADTKAFDETIALIAELADSSASGVLLAGLPAFLSWLDRSDAPASSVARVHMAMLESLALMPGWEAAGLELTGDLVSRVLAAGPTATAYGQMLDALDMIWARMASRRHASWFADTMEMLEFHPGDRTRLLGTFVTGVGPLGVRALPDEVREGLQITSDALHSDIEFDAIEAVEDHETAVVGQGRVVGIYSLSPQVAARARDRLTRRHPGLNVVHREDKVASEGLVSMVRSVDLLVVAIGSAKHSATDAIDAHRPPERPMIRHAFKGSTRIVEAVEREIAAGSLA
ncbi:protein DpdD [Solirubrobacter soli]|uniref:protein DpdD n=1 Tax=Solirubrobacter soli TaxID=363832 RepID=UPI000417E60D|nr:protein DpdD [Solirubrobacter soli]